ncbi:MAG TPA: Fic family protein [Coriobacteriia bacterium]
MPPIRWPEIVFAGDAPRETLSRAATAGRLCRLARGIYTPSKDAPEAVVRRNWMQILAREFPGAVIVDRSARSLQPVEGRLPVDHRRRHALVLPGLVIEPREGPGALPGDIRGPDGIWMSSPARGMLDNLARSGARYLSREEVEHWVNDIVARHGERRINGIRDSARALAELGWRKRAFSLLTAIIAAALSSGPADAVVTTALRARAVGLAYDRDRIALFESCAAFLADFAPEPQPALEAYAERRRLLPFYEAYFSNYIEGTEFTLNEAAAIVFDATIPPNRPDDAHDVLGTYRLVADAGEMSRTPSSGEELIELLSRRHATIMEGRSDKNPGGFKTRANRAGSTVFVEPALVRGTLFAGFEAGRALLDPFARAVFTMFLVSEVHPFADGNGRVARVMMNADLVSASEVRIIVPTGFRGEYISALKGATYNGSFASLASVLRFAQRYTARVDFSSRAVAERILARTNALVEPSEAEANGLHLTLP